jgi:predicted nucleic acid-binding protein
MIRAIIDTNVLVSALISPSGNEALLLLAVKQGLVRPCFSPAMLEEYSEVLARPKFAFSADEIMALIDLLQHQVIFCALPRCLAFLPTPKMTSSWRAPWRRGRISWSPAIRRISQTTNLEPPRS